MNFPFKRLFLTLLIVTPLCLTPSCRSTDSKLSTVERASQISCSFFPRVKKGYGYEVSAKLNNRGFVTELQKREIIPGPMKNKFMGTRNIRYAAMPEIMRYRRQTVSGVEKNLLEPERLRDYYTCVSPFNPNHSRKSFFCLRRKPSKYPRALLITNDGPVNNFPNYTFYESSCRRGES